ncbi:MAG: pteridine reductase [Gammaproteobacteria bacterium]|nr:pteridine reductase [Gammaproteobacteria bacterium]
MKEKVVLVTGAAHRVGAGVVRRLHESGANVVLHYRHSYKAAKQIADELNNLRENSVMLISADLSDEQSYVAMIDNVISQYNRLDALINNASSFFPTAIGEVGMKEWDDLMSSNLKAPFFLSQAAAPHLKISHGCIVNIVDIHADKPLKGHAVYCMAKAGLVMMTKSLAKELGPEIRVNAVAPGAIMWPEGMEPEVKDEILGRTALKRKGDPDDIAKTVLFLVREAGYMTGQILAVDGGRSLNL